MVLLLSICSDFYHHPSVQIASSSGNGNGGTNGNCGSSSSSSSSMQNNMGNVDYHVHLHGAHLPPPAHRNDNLSNADIMSHAHLLREAHNQNLKYSTAWPSYRQDIRYVIILSQL